MADIFISYSSQDRSRVAPFAKSLEAQGWSVWWDRTIPPGKTFDEVIEAAISDARCVVVLWSQASVKSSWVKEEASIGKQRNILIPAKIDPVDPPLGFTLIQAADLADWQDQEGHLGFSSLVGAIESILGPAPLSLCKAEAQKRLSAEKPKAGEEQRSIDEQERRGEAERQRFEQERRRAEAKARNKVRQSDRDHRDPSAPSPSMEGKPPPHTSPHEHRTAADTPATKRKSRLTIGVAALFIVAGFIGWFFASMPDPPGTPPPRRPVVSTPDPSVNATPKMPESPGDILTSAPPEIEQSEKDVEAILAQRSAPEASTKPNPPVPSTPAQSKTTPSKPGATEQAAQVARLYVDTVPQTATIRIMNIVPKFYQGIELAPGRYRLSISFQDHKTQDLWVFIEAGNDKHVEVRLEPMVIAQKPSAPIEPDQTGPQNTDSLRAGKDRHVEVGSEPIAIDQQQPRVTPDLSDKKITNTLGMAFVYIAPGSFVMGSPAGEPKRDNDERQHQVTLTWGYYLQTTEVAVGHWRTFVRATGYKTEAETKGGASLWDGSRWKKKAGAYWDNPGYTQDDRSPVTCVSWNDAQAFVRWLSREEGQTYRLPTEAEWEYACRAGTNTPFAFGKCLSTDQANHNGRYPMYGCRKGRYPGKPVAVESIAANAWGLHDMHGNVWEWCQDWYGDYPAGSVTDPEGPSSGTERVNRGGSWSSYARNCRSANRINNAPDYRDNLLGFRLAKTP